MAKADGERITFDAGDAAQWSVLGDDGRNTIRFAVIYDSRPRPWWQRLFSWPWQRNRPPLAVVDLTPTVGWPLDQVRVEITRFPEVK